jgi:hypothetical protein
VRDVFWRRAREERFLFPSGPSSSSPWPLLLSMVKEKKRKVKLRCVEMLFRVVCRSYSESCSQRSARIRCVVEFVCYSFARRLSFATCNRMVSGCLFVCCLLCVLIFVRIADGLVSPSCGSFCALRTSMLMMMCYIAIAVVFWGVGLMVAVRNVQNSIGQHVATEEIPHQQKSTYDDLQSE